MLRPIFKRTISIEFRQYTTAIDVGVDYLWEGVLTFNFFFISGSELGIQSLKKKFKFIVIVLI